jgi:hypothetical protein
MPKADRVEEILARLMPVSMSEGAEVRIRAAIEQSTQKSWVDAPSRPVWVARLLWSGAAVAVLTWGVWRSQTPDGTPAPKDLAQVSPQGGELVSLSHSASLQSVEEDRWQDGAQGRVLKSLRLRMVAEQQILDKETGIVMTVREPHEELVLYPVTAF